MWNDTVDIEKEYEKWQDAEDDVRSFPEWLAEISFKAGQDKGYGDGRIDGYNEATRKAIDAMQEKLLTGRKAGIREVVEEIKKHNLYEKKNSHSFYHDGGISFETSESLDDRKWWQAKLKEWGME